jgi:Ca2+ transporting ATPase
VEESIHHNHI